MTLILAILTGYLVRIDGMGFTMPAAPKWRDYVLNFAAKYGSVFTCSPLFGLLIYLTNNNLLVSLASAVAFLVWRLPGFRNGGLPNFVLRRLPYNFKVKWLAPENGWQHWRNMFVRGLWTSAIGFSLVAFNPLAVLPAIVFSLVYMAIYSGGYRWLPQTILGYDKHVWIEHASAWAWVPFLPGVI